MRRHNDGNVDSQSCQIVALLCKETVHSQSPREVSPFEEEVPCPLEGHFPTPQDPRVVHAVGSDHVGNTSSPEMLRDNEIVDDPSAVKHDDVGATRQRLELGRKTESSPKNVRQGEALHPLGRGEAHELSIDDQSDLGSGGGKRLRPPSHCTGGSEFAAQCLWIVFSDSQQQRLRSSGAPSRVLRISQGELDWFRPNRRSSLKLALASHKVVLQKSYS